MAARPRLVSFIFMDAKKPKWKCAIVRTVNSAYSVIEVWRRLVAAADFKVLHAERAALQRSDKMLEANQLFLKWSQEGEKREGPAYSIVKVCGYEPDTSLSSLFLIDSWILLHVIELASTTPLLFPFPYYSSCTSLTIVWQSGSSKH